MSGANGHANSTSLREIRHSGLKLRLGKSAKHEHVAIELIKIVIRWDFHRILVNGMDRRPLVVNVAKWGKTMGKHHF